MDTLLHTLQISLVVKIVQSVRKFIEGTSPCEGENPQHPQHGAAA